jgi:hypothetical protein
VPEPIRRETRWTDSTISLEAIHLPPRVPEELRHVALVDDPIEILLLRPHPLDDQVRPVVLMFPILNNGTQLMCEIGGTFARMGYTVAIVPRKELAFDPWRSVEQAEDELRVIIMRGKQALDWLETVPGVDAQRVGMFGISAGGIMGACLSAVDERVKASVLVFSGGPMADVMADTVESYFTRKKSAVRRARGWSTNHTREVLRGIIRTDPVLLGPRMDRENTLLFMTRSDRSVPTRNQYALWESIGRPEAHLLPGGHYTGFGFFAPFILERSRRYFVSRLGSPVAAGARPGAGS